MGLFGKKKVEQIREAIAHRPRRVLVVDDDALFLAQLADVLGRQGWEVVGVRSARAALERSDLARFDVILSDVVMPEVDGLEFLRLLRERPAGQTIKLVLMTSTDPAPLRPQAEALGCHGFLTKPVDERIVVETLQALLGG